MDELELEVIHTSEVAGTRKDLECKMALLHRVARPGATFRRLTSVPSCLAVDALKPCWNRSVVRTLSVAVRIGISHICPDESPYKRGYD